MDGKTSLKVWFDFDLFCCCVGEGEQGGGTREVCWDPAGIREPQQDQEQEGQGKQEGCERGQHGEPGEDEEGGGGARGVGRGMERCFLWRDWS